MSWFRSVVNKAVQAGGKNNLTHTVRNYADSVVLQAGNVVTEGAKILQHRIGAGNSQSFRITMKRLEEVSVSCRGMERVQLLRRWLVALKEVERLSIAYDPNNDKRSDEQIFFDEAKDSPRKPTLVYYVDPNLGEMNFRQVFLYSQALEGITLSMILEAPSDEEVSLLLEIFGLCLAGEKEVHKVLMRSIQDLAFALSTYQDEILIKREELLQYAQSAIAGLKINADIARIDAEAYSLMEKIDKTKAFHQTPNEAKEQPYEETTTTTKKALVETLGQIEICATLETLLVKMKSLSNGDFLDSHVEKVDKLKVLSESLLNSMSKAEKRILDHRSQKEQALDFRVTKASEISQIEKELEIHIGELERQKDELEAALKKVNNSLTSTRARLYNAREEREQFDEASNKILVHLKAREDELSRSITSYRVEADVVSTWIKFLEHTWVLHTTSTEKKKKQLNAELEKCGDYFVNLVIHLLTSYKEELEPTIIRIRGIVGDLNSLLGSDKSLAAKDANLKAVNQREYLLKEYWDLDVKFLATLSILDGVKKQYYSGNEGIYRKDDEMVNELFNALEKLKEEFGSIERPVLKAETPTQRSGSHGSPSFSSSKEENKDENKADLFLVSGEIAPAAVQLELEPMEAKIVNANTGYLSDEIGEWEFDEHEKELKHTT